jgi:transposase
MFFRTKQVKKYKYLQIVESYRENGKIRQRVILTLGNYEHWKESGRLDSLLASGARLSEKLAMISEYRSGKVNPVSCKSIGPDKIFGRIWEEIGVGDCIKQRIKDRRFGFDVERAIYRTVIHRIFESGSDRSSLKWDDGFKLSCAGDFDLHHLYRAMEFLGSRIEDQSKATRFGPRCVKDLIEESLFSFRRDLFSSISMVFFDTTSIYFEGEGGETLGEYGYSKDHRPDRKQMIVGVVLDGDGIPLCCEMWPGNTADVSTIKEVVRRFQRCFDLKNVCIVSDRGMISGRTLKFLESPDCAFSYILGVRMRNATEIKGILDYEGEYQEVKRSNPKHEPLKFREFKIDGKRYVLCVNEKQARKDAHDRNLMVEALREKLKSGEKSLVGNSGYRRFLKSTTGNHFQIDEEKILRESKFDGKWILTSNTAMDAAEIALQYKNLWMVETVFRTMKSGLNTRPIFHKTDRTIRGHVFCSFLAILLRQELEKRLHEKGYYFEWKEILNDLASVQEAKTEISGKKVVFRSEMKGCAGKIFQAVGVAVPPTVVFE